MKSVLLLLFVLFLTAAFSFTQEQENEASEGPNYAQKRAEAFWRLRSVTPGTNAARFRLNALGDREKIRARDFEARRQGASNYGSNFGSIPWVSIGPSAILGGVVPNAGRIDALALDPTNENIVYAGAADGGVWKTTDGGQSWTPLTDSQPSLAIGALAVDPNHPSTIYAGTGEAFPDAIATYGVGLLKSTDAGQSWTNIQGPFVPSGYGSGMDIAAIAISPQNSNIILVAAPYVPGFLPGGGLYRSADAGSTWAQVQATAVSAVAFDPNHSGVVFAGSRSAGKAMLLRSNDSGATWTIVYTLTGSSERVALSIAPSDSTVYAAFDEYQGAITVKSVDGGNTWTELTETVEPSGSPLCPNQCWYNLVLAVSPLNSQEVFFGTVPLSRSQDGGKTWYGIASIFHVDQHALVFSPSGDKLYIGDDGGVWSTPNPDAPLGTITFSSLNNGLATLQFYRGVSTAPGNPMLALGGTQDNGTALYQGQLQWSRRVCCDGLSTAINPVDPMVMYATSQEGDIWQSGDGGTTFSTFIGGLTPDQSDFTTQLAMDPKDPQRLYTESQSEQIARTVDGSSTWELASPALPDGVTSISVSPADDNVVWVSTFGPLLVTTNATGNSQPTWKQIPLPSQRVVTCIVPDPHDPTVAYAALSGFLSAIPDSVGHIVKLTQTGAAWTNISTNFPDIPANDIAVDPAVPNTLYVATDVGVFATSDGGTTWNSMGTGLPNSLVTGLAIEPQTRILRAGTHGRGMWDLQLPPAPIFTISPVSVDFGTETIGTTSAGQNISITNISAAVMAPGQAVVSGPFAATDSCGATLAPGTSCSYNVYFTPTLSGQQNGTLTIADSNSGESQSVALTGVGAAVTTAVFSLSPLTVSFGNQTIATTSAAQTVTATNVSELPISLQPGTITGPFQIVQNCGTTLATGASCNYTANFTPASLGPQSGTLTITDLKSGQSQTVVLGGTGIPVPSFTLSAANGSSTSETVTAGQIATYNLVAAPVGTFTGPVALACSGAPATTLCSIQPANLNLASSGSVAFVVSITTSAGTSAALLHGISRRLYAQGLFIFAALMVIKASGKNRGGRYLRHAGALCIGTLLLTSCGGGTASSISQSQPGTPAGSYQLVIKGSSSDATSSLNLNLTVK